MRTITDIRGSRRVMRRGVAALAALLVAAFAFGGEEYPLIKAAVKPKEATVGVPLEYRVNIAGKNLAGIEIVLPQSREFYPEKEKQKGAKPAAPGTKEEEPKPSEEVPLYVIHNARKENEKAQGLESIDVILEISFYRPGKHRLPEIEIMGSDHVKIGYQIPEVEIKPVNQKGELSDIEPPLDLGGNYTRLILLLLAVSLLTAGGIFLYRYLKKKREERLAAPVIIPPIDVFLADLDKLGPRELIARGLVEEYVFGISMAFRRFLSALLGIDAEEKTSDEIRRDLRAALAPALFKKHERDIMRSFELLDLAKFAEFAPTEALLLSNLEQIVSIAQQLSTDMTHDAN